MTRQWVFVFYSNDTLKSPIGTRATTNIERQRVSQKTRPRVTRGGSLIFGRIVYEARVSAIIGSLYGALGASQNSCPRKLEHVSSLMRKSATRFLDTTRSSGKRDCIVINIRMNSRCTRATVWSHACIAFLLRKCYCIVDCWSNVFVGIYLRLKLSRDLPSQIELIHLFLSTTRWLSSSKKVIEYLIER